MSDEKSFYSSSPEETLSIGAILSKLFFTPGIIVAFQGDLGAGKTTLIKGMISQLIKEPIDQINSPTFTYLNSYGQNPALYHFDLYRLKNEKEFVRLGFMDYFDAQGICLIEWPERIFSLLPEQTTKIEIHHVDINKRKITLKRNIH